MKPPTGKRSTRSTSQVQTSKMKTEFVGFVDASLFQMVRATGGVYVSDRSHLPSTLSFDAIRSRSKDEGKTLVVFPECTTSNARGLLKFADIFGDVVLPIKDFEVFVMCVRVDPPTALSPSLSLPLKQTWNPLPNLFTISSHVVPNTLSVRLLAPLYSPSSGDFKVSDYASETTGLVTFSEVCATLIADIGRLKRTGMGWEEKAALLKLIAEKR